MSNFNKRCGRKSVCYPLASNKYALYLYKKRFTSVAFMSPYQMSNMNEFLLYFFSNMDIELMVYKKLGDETEILNTVSSF